MFVMLITVVPYIADPRIQRYAVYFFVTAFLFLYSVLLKVFRTKNGGYPFKLVSSLIWKLDGLMTYLKFKISSSRKNFLDPHMKVQ